MRKALVSLLLMAGLAAPVLAQEPTPTAVPSGAMEAAPPPAGSVGAAPQAAASPGAEATPGAGDRPVVTRKEAGNPDAMRGKVGWLAGTWDVTMKMVAEPKNQQVEVKGTQTYTEILNGHFVEVDFQAQGPQGPIAGHGIIGWDRAGRVYRYWSFNDLGESAEFEGNWEDGDKLVLIAAASGGKSAPRQRLTFTKVSDAEYRYTLETDRGSGFKQDVEATATKRAQ